MQNVIILEPGKLFEDSFLSERFDSSKLAFINKLREILISKFPELREKINIKSKYFGFAQSNHSDSIYIYLQNNKMVMDIDIPYSMKKKLIQDGFEINDRKNFQSQSGWITGIRLDYEFQNLDKVVALAVVALSNI